MLILVLLSLLADPQQQRSTSISSLDEIFPQVVAGGEWCTTFTVANLDESPITIPFSFHTATGAPWKIELEGRGAAEKVDLVLQPKQTVTLTTAAAPGLVQGWGRLDIPCCPDVAGFAVFRQRVPGRPDFEAVTPLADSHSSRSFLAFDNTNGFSTGIALVNPSSFSTSVVTVNVRTENGERVLLDQITLPKLSKDVFSLPARFPVTDGKKGTIEFTSSPGQFSVLGLRFNPGGAFTSIHSWEP